MALRTVEGLHSLRFATDETFYNPLDKPRREAEMKRPQARSFNLDLPMLGCLVRLRSGPFSDDGHFVYCPDAAVIHWLCEWLGDRHP